MSGLLPWSSLSFRRKRKSRDREDSNGTCSVEENGVMENGERQVAKRSRKASAKQAGIEKNGNSRKAKTGNLSGKKDSAKRKKQEKGRKNVSNGTTKNLEVKRNGSLKEPRKKSKQPHR